MNVLSKMEQIANLTNSEVILSTFIMNFPYKFVKMKLSEVCEHCFVSKSTVYRLCEKLNLSGFSELKLMISKDCEEYTNIKNTKVNYDFPITAVKDLDLKIPNNLEQLYENTIKSTKSLVEAKTFKSVAELLKKAQVVDIYTSAGSVFFAENFQFQMAEIGKVITLPKEEYLQHLTAAKSDENHVAIVISFGGRWKNINSILSLLRANNTKIIFITSAVNKNSSITAEHLIFMNPYENHYNKISSFSTRLSLLYILDTIYAYYFQLDFDANMTFKINTYEKMVKKIK